MNTFAPNDRVVAVNTDLSRPLGVPVHLHGATFSFPDGPLRTGIIYHVAAVFPGAHGNQRLVITGLRVLMDNEFIPWNSTRFRKIDSQSAPPAKSRAKTRKVAVVKSRPNTRKVAVTLQGKIVC